MSRRFAGFGYCAGSIVVALLLATGVESQVGPPKAYMFLQSTSPGTSQSGHANISGTLRAGSGIISGTLNGTSALSGTNAGNTNSTTGILGHASSLTATGTTYGVYGLASTQGGVGTAGFAVNGTGAGIGVRGSASGTSGYGGYFTAAGSSGTGLYSFASAGTGSTFGGVFEVNSTAGTAVIGRAFSATGSTYGGVFESSSSTGRGVVGRALSTTGLAYGVYGTSSSTSGYGVLGESADSIGVRGSATGTTGANYGVYGISASSSGYGVYGATTSGTGTSYSVYGLNLSTGGTGVYGRAAAGSGSTFGVVGLSDSVSGTGVRGTGGLYGIYGVSTTGYAFYGTTGGAIRAAIYAENTNTSGNSDANGVRGVSNSFDAAGIIGRNNAGGYGVAGISSGNGTGVRGTASGSGSGVSGSPTTDVDSTGVIGVQNGPDPQAAVFAFGGFYATGAKAFKIDHPLDPANYYLNHFCTEGPEAMNAYSGNVVTDSKGYATIQLPDYFEEINANYRYQLTVLDDGEREEFALVKVVEKIKDNRFKIRTSVPNCEVSWRVEASRNDAYFRNRHIPTEEPKSKNRRGKYFYPEFFGQPASKAIFQVPTATPAGG